MNANDVRKKIEEIKEAIKNKKYSVSYDIPNFIDEHTAIDGTKYILVEDLDGPTRSNDFGCCYVKIAGISFSETLEPYEPVIECSYLDSLENMEREAGDNEDYVEIIKELIESIPEFSSALSMSDIDGQVENYKKMTGSDLYEFYSYDERLPVDEDDDDFTPIEESDEPTVEFSGQKYYVVDVEFEDTEWDDEEDEFDGADVLIAVKEGAKPNMFGQYPTMRLIRDGETIIRVEKNKLWYDGVNGEVEEGYWENDEMEE